MDDYQWNVGDASAILNAYTNQMFTTTGVRRLCAWEETKWVLRVRDSPIEKVLYEDPTGPESNPTGQYHWALAGIFETDSLPHQTCMSLHQLPNVKGPIRSEVMIIAAILSVRIKKSRFQDQIHFPLLMLSVIGRDARIIQAHMCTHERRLKVRYSQMCDFSYYTPQQRDTFLRWLLCDPVTRPRPIADEDERSATRTGDLVLSGSSRATSA